MATATDFTVNSSSLGTYYTPFGSTIAVQPDGTALVAWVNTNVRKYGTISNTLALAVELSGSIRRA